MKAIVQNEYGSPDVLELKEIDRPVVKDNEVLVRVRAAALHAGDYFALRGVPIGVRMVVGLLKPRRNYVPGFDVAGHVEAVGRNVTRFQPGDEVFGACNGTCAEYACAAEDNFVPKPANLTFEQAAAVPTSAIAALHGLRDAGKVQPGQKVLINGASGGVGTFAVQIAKAFGAEVTGVCSTRNVDMVRSIGADHVIDYTQEDFTQGGQRYDLILDNVANRSFSDCRRALNPQGTLIPNSGHGGMGYVVKALVLSAFVRQQGRPYIAIPNNEDLVVLKELVESGKVTPVIDRTYPLSEVPEAMGYVAEGHARGKVVITVEHDNRTARPGLVSEVVEPAKRGATNIIDIEGIGPVYAEKLGAIGIKTTMDLLEAGSTPQEREELAEKTGISPKRILKWVNIADLMRIKGVGEEYSELLEEAGVDSVAELSKRNPENLHAKLLKVNEEKRLVRRVPSLNAVRSWIALAHADDMLHDLFLRYDENLKGGAHAVKSDDSSRPRNRFSGGEMEMAIALRGRGLPVMMHPHRSLSESIEKASEPHNRDYEENPELVEEIEKAAYELGADLVSFTEVTPDNIYADKEVPYRYVIAVAIRMDSEKIATAPSVDCGIETANTTVALGVLVNRLSDKIKETGHDAVPGPALGGPVDYPSLARMAGMGEYGRHGLLISPFNGSCQRIAAVFTNLELPIEKSNPHRWVRDFCSSCGKCVRACPCNAIREEPVPTKAGHYSCVETGKCLLYLVTHFGCSICIKECPFTTMSYDRIKEAFERGQKKGNVVVTVEHD